MKNASIVLSSLALIGVIILFIMNFSGGPNKGSKAAPITSSAQTRIAYVNIDTFEANYEYLKTKRAEFQKKQESMRAELQNSERQMQSDIAALQRKAQAGTLTQAEGEAGERRIIQMQQSLRTREQALTEQLLTEQDEFNNNLHQQLDSFIKDYNKDKRFDYILSYSRSGQVIYANEALDITKDVIKGMNELSKDKLEAAKKN